MNIRNLILILAALFLPAITNFVTTAQQFSPIASTWEKSVPILCYHNIKENVSGKSADYTIQTKRFYDHLQMLRDSGFNTILPKQLLAYMQKQESLPDNPIMITFDDSHHEHYTVAAPALEKFNFNGVFFVLGVTIGKPTYLSKSEIADLRKRGHIIAGHTWIHPDMRRVPEKNIDQELETSQKLLAEIINEPIDYFAYPNGAWNETLITHLKKKGIKAAFQLSGKRSELYPEYTIRRLLVSGNWSPATLYKNIRSISQ